MQVELPDKTIRDVEAMLAKRGENGNVSEFIDRTLQRVPVAGDGARTESGEQGAGG